MSDLSLRIYSYTLKLLFEKFTSKIYDFFDRNLNNFDRILALKYTTHNRLHESGKILRLFNSLSIVGEKALKDRLFAINNKFSQIL